MAGTTYTVQSGDTLSGIAAKYGVSYQDIASANNIANPNLIYPGQTFTIPGAGAPTPTTPTVTPTVQSTPQTQTTPQTQSQSSGGGTPPPYAPNTVNQTVDYGGTTWKGNPGTGWTAVSQTGGGSIGSTGSISAAPTIDLVAITNAAYNTPEITAAQQAITDRQTALNTALAGINDNPFYSEATRVGKVAKLTDEANADIKVQQDTLASLKADAAIKVNAAQGQYQIDNTAYQENLSQFNSLLSSGALDNASGTDIANLATQTGIPTSEIQSMVNASKAKNAPKVSIVQSTDDQGNLTILGVDDTGKIVSRTTIPGAGKETTYKGQPVSNGSGGNVTPTPASTGTEKQQNTDNLITSIKNYNNLKDVVAAYSGVISIDQIYQLYNTYSPFGPAQNTLAEVKAGTITK